MNPAALFPVPHSAPPPASPPMAVRVLCILWPAFLMAGVAEMLVFVVVDPAALLWFGSTPVGWSVTAVYSVTFLLLWGLVSTASAMTQLLLGFDKLSPNGERH